MRRLIGVFLAIGTGLLAQERGVEPTWLYRDVSVLHDHETDLTSKSCHFTPVFGEGDVESRLPLSVVRFGELTVNAQGACQTVEYPHQEELYFVRDGSGVLRYGEESRPLAPNDFTYVPPTVPAQRLQSVQSTTPACDHHCQNPGRYPDFAIGEATGG
jgi:mannose-6-phosphate isomerase-like protein (cupin superfamily)